MPWPNRSLQFVALWILLLPAPAFADSGEMRTYSKAAAFEDVQFELGNAILEQGLTVHSEGEIASMLERTGPEVGSTRPIYAKARFVNFCSAKLSRQLMEADPAHLGYCPFAVFLYEAAGTSGTIVVGYRRPVIAGSPASRAALQDLDALLDGIAKAAVR